MSATATSIESAQIGKPAPDFNMASTKNIEKLNENVKLSDYKGKWVILLFYPLDFTFVCPTELTTFSDRYDDFEGVEGLRYPLASDGTGSVARDYGVLIEDKGIALRGLFVIDPEGILRYKVVHDLNIGRSADETLRVVQALQTGGLCQAEWRPGQKTLNG